MQANWSKWIPYAIIGVLVLLFAFTFLGTTMRGFDQKALSTGSARYSDESAYGYDRAMADFAPDVQDRKITKAATLSTELQRGEFDRKNDQLHTIVTSVNGFILEENVREVRDAKLGDYNIKVPAENYDAVVSQLKALGDVVSFTENARDVTGQYVNNDIELEVEQERLVRLQNLYSSRSSLEDKLKLENAIFDQERKIKYLEDALERIDQNVIYSTLSVSMHEPESALADLRFVGFGELVKTFVASLKALLYFIFAILPWAILVVIGIVVYRVVKKRM